ENILFKILNKHINIELNNNYNGENNFDIYIEKNLFNKFNLWCNNVILKFFTITMSNGNLLDLSINNNSDLLKYKEKLEYYYYNKYIELKISEIFNLIQYY